MAKTFSNQNQRAKIRLEFSEGVLVEVPLAVIVRAIQEQYAHAAIKRRCLDCGVDDPDVRSSCPKSKGHDHTVKQVSVDKKERVHWAFPDFFSEEDGAMVHLIVTTKDEDATSLRAERNRRVEATQLGQLSEELEEDNMRSAAMLVRSAMHELEDLRAKVKP